MIVKYLIKQLSLLKNKKFVYILLKININWKRNFMMISSLVLFESFSKFILLILTKRILSNRNYSIGTQILDIDFQQLSSNKYYIIVLFLLILLIFNKLILEKEKFINKKITTYSQILSRIIFLRFKSVTLSDFLLKDSNLLSNINKSFSELKTIINSYLIIYVKLIDLTLIIIASFLISFKLTLLSFLFSIVLYLVVYLNFYKQKVLIGYKVNRLGTLNLRINKSMINNFEEIKVNQTLLFLYKNFKRNIIKISNKLYKISIFKLIEYTITKNIFFIFLICFIVLIGSQNYNFFNLVNYSFVFFLFNRLINIYKQIFSSSQIIISKKLFIHDIYHLLKVNRNDKKQSTSIKANFNKIILKNVNYRYPKGSSCILKKINLIINSNDKILISGESGSGKLVIEVTHGNIRTYLW